MTDKQQIENMAQILFDTVDDAIIFEQITITGGRVKTDCYALAEALYNENYRQVPKGAVVLTGEEYNALMMEQKRLNKVVKHFQELIEDGKLVSRIGEDEIVVKADKYKRLVSILKNLKALAHDVDDYRDDIIADYRNMAETYMDWIIEELLNLNEEELL